MTGVHVCQRKLLGMRPWWWHFKTLICRCECHRAFLKKIDELSKVSFYEAFCLLVDALFSRPVWFVVIIIHLSNTMTLCRVIWKQQARVVVGCWVHEEWRLWPIWLLSYPKRLPNWGICFQMSMTDMTCAHVCRWDQSVQSKPNFIPSLFLLSVSAVTKNLSFDATAKTFLAELLTRKEVLNLTRISWSQIVFVQALHRLPADVLEPVLLNLFSDILLHLVPSSEDSMLISRG
jgi:hypothetical protein